MNQKFFSTPDPKTSVDEVEQNILEFWNKKNIFQQSIDSRDPNKEFVFFDGPPFATGTPHYGHILAGTIKDAIPRYWTMKGYRVPRKWGWDCHGVPVEYGVEKEHGIKGKPEIEEMGVAKFNEMCRDVVLRYANEWEATVDRMGRFVDFKDDYKTMDPEFMESVWWVFKSLWDKGLIYEGHKVVAYSPKLGSPLSNFEANLNYQDIDDPAVTVKFELIDEVEVKPVHDKKTYILAWTTTPWTLPSNCGLGMGRDHEYILIEHEGEYFWIAEGAATRYFPEDFEVLARRKGSEFKGLRYRPLFDFFDDGSDPNRFQVIHDDGDYVSLQEGTGIVHFAPFFGAEDAELCAKYDIHGVNPINDDGYFTEAAPPLEGKYFREDSEVEGSKENNANMWVINALKESGLLFRRDQVRHSYPHCWRTDCALMYRGVTTWFVKVTDFKDDMMTQNQNINWTPEHIKNGRFGKILEGAPDWAISRNRYWGCPLPIWRCDKTGVIEVMGSKEDLEKKAGVSVSDLHRHFIDDLTWENPKTGGTMRRIEEVLDCWFESGSMPYASIHYPFCESGKYELQSAKSKEEKEKCWEFFVKMWKGEFGFEIDTPERKENFMEVSKTWYVEEDKKLLGSLELYWEKTNKCWNIGRIGVIKDERRTGIGTALMEAAETFLQQENQTETSLNGEQKSAGFYEKLGFEKISEFEPADKNPEVLAAKFTKKLSTINHQPTTFRTANFISEGMDQTRGWFYTLHVLGTALFGKNIFDNVICSGIVLAEDGQKMSKSKKNYPDPSLIFEKYGADSMRFYLLQSPVATKGESLKFIEREVEEVLKNTVLPLKNAYQFLSMYAEIDRWSPTKFTWMRHGEAMHNVNQTYAGKEENCKGLTDTGKAQAESLKEIVTDFDHLVASPLPRAQETATIVGEKFETDDRLREINFGNLEGTPWKPIPERLANDTTENLDETQTRAESIMHDLNKSHYGQHIGLVTHAALIRCAQTGHLFGHKTKEEHLPFPQIRTGMSQIVFPLPQTENELDKWILSETQTLIKAYTKAFDAYDTEKTCHLLPPFIDKLNNWYLRQSRERFWGEGLSEDKRGAYETLHYVLLNVSKLMAPIMPFFADHLYRNLTNEPNRSVHLEFLPLANDQLVDKDLEKRIDTAREIVKLSAAIRARSKIKLRQPLGKLQFALSEEIQVDPSIIAREANVKEVEVLKSTEGVAEKIIKVDARKVGPKFGKKVQELIQAGKSGDFEILENGKVQVAGEILEADEYETAFMCEEGLEADSTPQVVVLLNTEITPELELEGLSREFIRAIQELRKSSGFEVSDRIEITYQTSSEKLQKMINKFADHIAGEVLANSISEGRGDQEYNFDGALISISIFR